MYNLWIVKTKVIPSKRFDATVEFEFDKFEFDLCEIQNLNFSPHFLIAIANCCKLSPPPHHTMTHADAFEMSSDVEPEEEHTPSHPPSTPASTLGNITMLASAAASVSSSPIHLPWTRESGINASGTTLGRRHREGSAEAWSGRDKVRIAEFVEATCTELGVPLRERDEIHKYSKVCQ